MDKPAAARHTALAALARAYLPEWNFSQEQPDSGSAVAMLIDDMLGESEKRLSQAIHKYKIQYLNLFDRLKEEPVESAKSYVRFTQVSGMEQPVHVPKGTRLIAEDPVAYRRLIFETAYAITTTSARLVSVCSTDKGSDRIVRLLDHQDGAEDSKGFTAFGLMEENEAEHRLLLGFDGVFDAMDGLSIGLRIETQDPEARESVLQALLSEDVRYSMLEPDGERGFEKAERRDDLIWLTLPSYQPIQTELAGKPCYVLCVRSLALSDISLCSVELVFSQEGLPADEVLCAEVAQNVGRFTPFGSPMEIFADCTIECRSAFARRGAEVEMGFELDFLTVEQKLPEVQNNPDYKIIMRRPQEAPRLDAVEVKADYVLLEYRTENGWHRLLDDEHTALLFNGSASGKVSIRFTLPKDIAPEDGQGRLRLRLYKADHLYSIPCVQYCPVISNLSFSYRYTQGSLLPDTACTRNNFEVVDVTDNIRLKRTFPLFYNREHTRPSMYLGFDQNPQGMPLSLYFEVENDEDTPVHYTVEYLSERGFEQMQAIDNTGGLLYAGTLLLPVPTDCAKTKLFDRDCYWVRMVARGELPQTLPIIRTVLTNMARVENRRSSTETFYLTDPDAPLHIALAEQNLVSIAVYVNEEDLGSENEENWVRWSRRTGWDQRGRCCDIDLSAGTVEFSKNAFAPYPLHQEGPTVLVEYESYQGSAANVESDTITTMSESLRGISSVTNPMPAYGGYDGYNEQTSAAVISNMLRTRGRAVTERDYFDMILQVSYGVRRIKCLSGVNRLGEADDDAITVALLIDEYDKGSHIFSAVRDTIRRKLEQSGCILPLGKNLILSQPNFVRFSVRAWVSCGPGQDMYELQQQTMEDIRTFIDPLTGGFEGSGWEIGTLPTVRYLLAWLKLKRPGLTVTRIVISARTRGREFAVDDEIAKTIRNPFAMAVNGEHTVYVDLLQA